MLNTLKAAKDSREHRMSAALRRYRAGLRFKKALHYFKQKVALIP